MATVINPETKRLIKVGGVVYKRLVARGVIQELKETLSEEKKNNLIASSANPQGDEVSHTLSSISSSSPSSSSLSLESFDLLNVKEIVDRCNANESARAFCEENGIIPKDDPTHAIEYWLACIADGSYENRRNDFMGLMDYPVFYPVIRTIASMKELWIDPILFDDYHIHLVSQGEDQKALELVRSYGNGKDLSDWGLSFVFTAPALSLTQIDRFVKFLRTKQPKKMHYDALASLGRGEYDPRLSFLGERLYIRFDPKELPEIIANALSREGGKKAGKGSSVRHKATAIRNKAKAEPAHLLGYLLFRALVADKKSDLIEATKQLVKNKEAKELLAIIEADNTDPFAHQLYRYHPRDLAYYFMKTDFVVRNYVLGKTNDRAALMNHIYEFIGVHGYDQYFSPYWTSANNIYGAYYEELAKELDRYRSTHQLLQSDPTLTIDLIDIPSRNWILEENAVTFG